MAASAASGPTSAPSRSRRAARRCGAGASKVTSVPRASSRTARGARLGCAGMTAADVGIAAADVSPESNHWIRAAVILVFAFGLASLVDRGLRGRGQVLAENVFRGELTREASTRLRFVRRLIYAGIVFLGVAFALSEFQGIHRLANSLLASGAIAAAILGFAARQTLANLVAGVMLAVTQPIRVGDWIALDDYAGGGGGIPPNPPPPRPPRRPRLLT